MRSLGTYQRNNRIGTAHLIFLPTAFFHLLLSAGNSHLLILPPQCCPAAGRDTRILRSSPQTASINHPTSGAVLGPAVKYTRSLRGGGDLCGGLLFPAEGPTH